MNIKTLPIREDWIEELVDLSDLHLGKGYLTKEYFIDVINNELYEGVSAFEGKKLIAFLIYYTTNRSQVIDKLEDKSLSAIIDSEIICFDTMVVALTHRKQGVGKKLINSIITNKKKKVGFIMYTWKQDGIINMKSIAEYFQFNQIKEYPDLWKYECENNSFNCPVKTKDNTFCLCSCMLYYRNREK